MVVYFIPTQFSGFIGLLGTILNALYFFALGLLLNIIIQRTRGNDLRLRIAGSSSFFSLWSELRAADEEFEHTGRWLIMAGLLILVLAGNSISFIVNTGIKATTTGIAHYPAASWRFSHSAQMGSNNLGHIVQSRLNSTDLLAALFLYIADRGPIFSYKGADFKVLSEATPVAVIGANANYDTALPIANPAPGTVSLTRLLHPFSKNDTPSCDQTLPSCELTSMRTTLAPWVDPSYLFDTPWKVIYNNHEGKPITIANVSRPIGTGNAFRDGYIAERPTTLIAGYTEDNGISVMVAITTASFQTKFSSDGEYGLTFFRYAVSDTIVSKDPLYTSIYSALNASVASQPQNRTAASNNVTLVYNTPLATSDNSTHISCVLYEANVLRPDRPNQVQNMVSCRELHISARSSTGATPAVGDFNDYNVQQDYSMLLIYNATSPSQMILGFGDNAIRVESVTKVAMQTADLLTNLTERIYPFMANYTGIVQPWEYKEGISMEQWSLVFVCSLVGVVLTMVAIERFLVEDIWRADVLTLIENTTKEYISKKRWENRYAEWSIAQENGSYKVRLRGELVSLGEETVKVERLEGMMLKRTLYRCRASAGYVA
ncbi:hypothetical protein BGZ95_000385 [Linnemannia exigua]|uniref:Uncharacterized protein n=1 Tax=Linnemannia exigua TaxID=604196 RepID=A0AAD4H9Y9_9FUNG|nr:hypothetical protein BGZ95_000385 [Linnemannia exigua]